MQNFGKIKNTFNDMIVEGIAKKDAKAKKLFKQYIKTIKESEILKAQFLIYNNIENRVDSDETSANLYISENLRLLEKYKIADIVNENKKLVKLLDKNGVKLLDTYKLSGLHESISNLISTKKTPKNVGVVVDGLKKVGEYIKSNKKPDVVEHTELPMSVLRNIMVEKYNEKYGSLEESDRKILKTLIGSNLEDKEKLYYEVVSECKVLVGNLIEGSDEESKNKLLKVKAKLETKEDLNESNFIEKFYKIIELKENLKK